MDENLREHFAMQNYIKNPYHGQIERQLVIITVKCVGGKDRTGGPYDDGLGAA